MNMNGDEDDENNADIHLCSYLTQQSTSPGGGITFTTPHHHPHSHAHRTSEDILHRVASLSHLLSTISSIGDRMCTLALASADHLEALLAITAAGGIAAPLNWRWSGQEVVHAMQHLESKIICIDEHNVKFIQEFKGGGGGEQQSIIVIILGSNKINLVYPKSTIRIIYAEEALIQTPIRIPPQQRFRHNPKKAACIIFTSGTTGPPRAALLSHASLHFQCGAKIRCCGYAPTHVYLHTAQLFHVGGLCSALAMLRAGARQHVFLPLFRPDTCLELIQRYNVTSFIAVPTMISDLLSSFSSSSYTHAPLHSVKTVLVGAGGLSEKVKKDFFALVPGAVVVGAYGMTEACSSITFYPLTEQVQLPPLQREGGGVYVGCPPPDIDIKIQQQQRAPPAEYTTSDGTRSNEIVVGQVMTRGPHLFTEYWNDPVATKESFIADADGHVWFCTGDLGTVLVPLTSSTSNTTALPKQLWLIGRMKDVVKSGGENVAAAEVERALMSHPGVGGAAVVGLPDDRWGERVAAAIVLQPGYTYVLRAGGSSGSSTTTKMVMEGSLQEWCRNHSKLASFKVPKTIIAVDALPVNATGKVVKEKVKQQFTARPASKL